jgi:O-antigen/teichoic acid export membrane protein
MTEMSQAIGPLVVGFFLNTTAAAQIAIAQKSSLTISFFLIAINSIIAPHMARMYHSGDTEAFRSISCVASMLLTLLVLPIWVLFMFFAPLIMEFFDAAGSDSAFLLRVLATAQMINVISGPGGTALMMAGREREFKDTVLLSGIISALFVPALTFVFGVKGAAFGIAFCLILQNLYVVYLVKKRLGFMIVRYRFGILSSWVKGLIRA